MLYKYRIPCYISLFNTYRLFSHIIIVIQMKFRLRCGNVRILYWTTDSETIEKFEYQVFQEPIDNYL